MTPNHVERLPSWLSAAGAPVFHQSNRIVVEEQSKPDICNRAYSHQVESLAENPEEELEVVDFSDLGKFIGVTEEETPAPEPEPIAVPPAVSARPPRPVASDFFDDRPPRSSEVVLAPVRSRARIATERCSPDASFTSEAVATASSSQAPFYKEATMSTLDDVMSRIKGCDRRFGNAVSLFHSSPAANLSVQKERWVLLPSARDNLMPSRKRYHNWMRASPVTKPAWNTFIVRLPKISQPWNPLNRKQLLLCNRPSLFRWDVLSFDPPVEGMSDGSLR
ncbi:hypothetical protein B0H13DRAFT_2320754 [Mycena leptocephala]|nr:hypothetical protein B0H13DRAFT_2320754 [Mycena leptocephala]